MSKSGGSNPLLGILALVAVLGLGFAGVGYAMGWIEFVDSEDRTTIEFKKNEAAADTEYAAEKSREMLNETGKAIQEAGESFNSEVSEEVDELDGEVEVDVDVESEDDTEVDVDNS